MKIRNTGEKKKKPVRELMKKIYRKKPWNNAVTFIAATLVFITTYMLILPAITMTKDVLDCPYVGETEAIILHQHDAACYDKDGVLVCKLPERKVHVHDDSCYEKVVVGYETMTRGQALAEGREIVEDQGLFTDASVADGPTTVMDAAVGSVDEFFADVADGQYAAEGQIESGSVSDVLVSSVGDADQLVTVPIIEKKLICTKEELNPELHIHDENCYQTIQTVNEDGSITESHVLICTKPVAFVHQHGDECFKKEGSDDILEILTGEEKEEVPGIEIFDEQEVPWYTQIDEAPQTDYTQIAEIPQETYFPEGDGFRANGDGALVEEDGILVDDVDPTPVVIVDEPETIEENTGLVIIEENEPSPVVVEENDSLIVVEENSSPVVVEETDVPVVVEESNTLAVVDENTTPDVEESDSQVSVIEDDVTTDDLSVEEDASGKNIIIVGDSPAKKAQNETEAEDTPVILAPKKIEDELVIDDTFVHEEDTVKDEPVIYENVDTLVVEEEPQISTDVVVENSSEITTEYVLEVSSETVSEVATEMVTEANTEVTTELVTETTISVVTEVTTEANTEADTEVPSEVTTIEAITEVEPAVATDNVTEISTETAEETASEIASEAETEVASAIATEEESEITTEEAIEPESEIVTEAVAETVYEIITEVVNEPQSEITTEDVEASSEAASEATTEITTEAVSEAVSEIATEITTESVSETSSEATTETTTELTSEASSEATTETTTELSSEASSEVPTTAVLAYDGRDYHVRLTFDNNSGIPDGAELSVSEIDPESEEYNIYLSQAKVALGLSDDATVPKEYARFFDITILADGEEIQPKNEVKVEIIYDKPVADVKDESVNANVLHFNEEKEAAVLQTLENGVEEGVEVSIEGAGEETADVLATDEIAGSFYEEEVENNVDEFADDEAGAVTEEAVTVTDDTADSADNIDSSTEEISKSQSTDENVAETENIVSESEEIPALDVPVQDNGVAFTTDSFSVFGIIYTVDFHYEVDGKTYEFSIPGGGFVSLEHLVEALGIASTDSDVDSEHTLDEADDRKDSSQTGEEDDAQDVPYIEDGTYREEENENIDNAENAPVTDHSDAGDSSVNDDESNADTDVTDNIAFEEAVNLNNTAVSEKTRAFVAEVVSVEFSSPELVWVGKVEDSVTVGNLKDVNDLDCQYSAELTEKQITEINNSTVEGGDWALIGLLPFKSEENLTVTMNNGEQFVVKVTDAQIKKTIIDSKGDKWEITVTYGVEAQIPEGAELRVREILPEDKDYQSYYNQSLKTVGVVKEQDSIVTESIFESATVSAPEYNMPEIPVDKYARIFDIEIWADNHKIEPKSNVIVNIRLLDVPEKSELLPHVVHFAENETELLELAEESEIDFNDVQFETDEFSVYSVVYTADLIYDPETGTLSYEDSKIKVTVSAKEKNILPDEAVLVVKEMIPEASDAVDTYAKALTALSNELREQNYSFSAVKVYDFSIFDKKGNEIEPNGEVEVKIEYKKKPDLSENGRNVSDIQIAHLVEDPSDEDKLTVEFVKADIDATNSGTVSGAEFTTDSFSAYIVFNRNGISEEEPTDLGNYGWIRFNTVGDRDTTQNQTADPDSTSILWGYYKNDGSNLPALNTAWAYRRILKVRLWLPKSGQDSSVYDSDHYNETATAQYFWVWQNEVNIEEFELPGYEVVHTRMHTAWDEENGKEPVENDSLVGSYSVRGYRRSTISNEPGAKNSDLNVLDIYAKQLPQTSGMNYIIRYVHADGSVTDGNVRSLSGGSVTFDASQYVRDGEVYAGTSIVTGTEAINANTANGTGTITYKANVPLAKVYIYYKNDPIKNGNPNSKGRYDKDENGYYTGAKGLYTDKSAQTVSGNDRQFILNLESWYVDNAASVGMVLDASGSMAWTSGAPEPIILTNEQVAEVRKANGMTQDRWGNWSGNSDIFFNGGTNDNAGNPPHSGQYITTFSALSKILDINKTDNSAMGYNGYHYYLKDMRSSVREYVALGYSDGNQSSSESLGGKTIYTTQVGNYPYNGTVLANRFIKNQNNAHGQNEGWYYVNSTGNTKAYNKYTGKSYDGYSSKGNVTTPDGTRINLAGGPLRFYIKTGTNELWVSYYNSGDNEIRQSPVYEKRDKMFTKMETLQDAVSQFGAIVLGSSPESQIGITRFSQQIKNGNDNDAQYFDNSSFLPLLNWSSSTEELSAAMNLSTNAKGSTNRNDDGLTVYEYGLTGQTRTWTGVKAYSDYLKNNATAANHKYLVIFTDGKDTNGDADSSTWGKTGTEIQALKNAGYTIITVMMRSQAMTGNEYTSAKAFLQGIASPGLDGNTSNTAAENKLYFEADSNSTKDVIDAFRQIAHKISAGLNGYTVRDYIDPRFDLINDAGDVLTVLDSNGQFTNATNPDIDAATGLRAFSTPDNKQAYLGYDSAKKMFYVLWKDQEIPATTLNSINLNPWKSQIRIQAKEDFLGGNDILSNGNETGMNQVYYPNSTDSSGMTPVTNNANYPSKDFPKTTTNPGTLQIALSNYEDTIFLGETISPASLYENVQTKRNSETDDRSLYFNYLIRAGKKFQNDSTYYVNLLMYGTVPSGASNTNPAKDQYGNDIPDFVFTSDANGVTELTLPYYYLENPGDAQSYAGGTLHQGDKVGKVTYSWKATDTGGHTLTDNNALLDYESTTLDTVRYRLAVTYTPDDAKYDSLDAYGNVVGDGGIADNGSARTLKLTGQYGTDKLIKDPVGGPAQSQTTITNPEETMGLAAIHVVAGKIKITKRIEVTESRWTELVEQAGDNGLTFTFQLKKDGIAYGSPISLTMKADNSTRAGNYVELSSAWIANLPQGDYTIEETGMPSGYTFKSVSADIVVDTDGDGGVNGTGFVAPTEGSVTWKIGKVSGGSPSSTTYAASDFTAVKVKDIYKEVDPDKSKAYLNAQIGKGIILNEPPKTIDVTIKKVDIKDLSSDSSVLLKGAKFTITRYTNSNFNVIDTDSPWSSTLDDEKEGNTYSLNGTFEFKGLPIGFYKINEARMPEGYISVTEDPVFEVRVKAGTSDLEVVLYKKNGNAYETVNSGTTEIARIAAAGTLVVGNTPGAALPATGGPGTHLIYLFGILFTAIASAGLVMKKRRAAA